MITGCVLVDYENEIQLLKAKIASYEKIILETSAPIIPSIVEDRILVPIRVIFAKIVLI